jgi:hypothetical protein
MCQYCFNGEIKSFHDKKSWLSFDIELTTKLSHRKMELIRFVHDGIRDEDDGEYIYACKNCHDFWKFKEPDLTFKGYFLKLSLFDKVMAQLTRSQKIVLGIGIVILIIFLDITAKQFAPTEKIFSSRENTSSSSIPKR